MDEQGVSDPNSISFTAHIGYGQTAVTNPVATISILGGVPSYYAVMVDGTNFTNPDWQPCTASPTVPLPDVEGEHLVWVALRGRVNATDWQGFGVTLDHTPPALVLTGPTNGPTFKPIIQVTGYSTDAVWSVSCTLSNALGIETNITALATEQDFGSSTTNHFQCFDVELTNGLNALTVRVSDLAGNVSTTNLNLTFETTNDFVAPLLTVLWPQTGSKLGADTFTLRARLDDETASLNATLVGGSGTTNEYAGLVERNGAVWVEGLTLEAGTNWLTLTATDAAGNPCTTNLMLIRSSVNVTVADIPENQLNQATVEVSGTISVTGYEVWANGVQGTVTGTDWTAPGVPLPPGGSAIIAITVFPIGSSGGSGSGGGGGGGSGGGGSGGSGGGSSDPSEENPSGTNCVDIAIEPEKPAEVKLIHGEWSRGWHENVLHPDEGGGLYSTQFHWNYDETTGGYAEVITSAPAPSWSYRYWVDAAGAARYESWLDEQLMNTEAFELGPIFGNDFAINGPMASGQWAKHTVSPTGDRTESQSARVNVVLRTGGRSKSSAKNLFIASASAQEKTATGNRELPAQQLAIESFGQQGADAQVPAAHPDNAQPPVNVQATAAYYTFGVGAPKYPLKIKWGVGDITDSYTNTTVGVGVTLTCGVENQPAGSVLTNIQWTIGGKVVAGFYTSTNSGDRPTNGYPIPLTVTNQSSIHYYWYDEKDLLAVKCNAALRLTNGSLTAVAADAFFSVDRPTGKITIKTGEIAVDGNVSEADLVKAPIWLHFGSPTNLGVTITNSASLSTNFPGHIEWVQLGSTIGNAKSNGAWGLPLHQAGLDSTYPLAVSSYSDSPGVGITSTNWTEVTGGGNFSVFLMFKPDGADTIAVPLRNVQWDWTGRAVNTNGVWQLVPEDCSHSENPDDQDWRSFPGWNSIILPFGATPP